MMELLTTLLQRTEHLLTESFIREADWASSSLGHLFNEGQSRCVLQLQHILLLGCLLSESQSYAGYEIHCKWALRPVAPKGDAGTILTTHAFGAGIRGLMRDPRQGLLGSISLSNHGPNNDGCEVETTDVQLSKRTHNS